MEKELGADSQQLLGHLPCYYRENCIKLFTVVLQLSECKMQSNFIKDGNFEPENFQKLITKLAQ